MSDQAQPRLEGYLQGVRETEENMAAELQEAHSEGRLEGMRELARATKEDWPSATAMLMRMDNEIAAAERELAGGKENDE